MLTEERFLQIKALVDRQGTATVQELTERLASSESTIRRDLNEMDRRGMLTKVHGGAVSRAEVSLMRDEAVALREEQHGEEKQKIAACAAALLEPGDFVYLDAGTTTERMLDSLAAKEVAFVTNALALASRLARLGYKTLLLGGEVKTETEAVVGEDAVERLRSFHFSKGFFGANAVHSKYGYMTPDVREAAVKRAAMEQCAKRYVLADASKFDKIAQVGFGDFEGATCITTGAMALPAYRRCGNLLFVKEE